MKNYSKNYPIKCLSEGDGTYIANKTTKIFSDPEQFKTTIDTFFENLEPVLNAGFTACASAHGKSVEDLTDEEIMDVVDKVPKAKGARRRQRRIPQGNSGRQLEVPAVRSDLSCNGKKSFPR